MLRLTLFGLLVACLKTNEATLLDTLHQLNSSREGGRFIFGHQHTNYEGQDWKAFSLWTGQAVSGEKSWTRTDVTNTSGRWPGLAAYNLEKLTSGTIDWTPYVLGASKMGAVIAFHWEASNPVTGGDAHDLTGNPMVELLPGGSANKVWMGWLDQIAHFLLGLQTQMSTHKFKQMIFRPFHEMTGSWYWWGVSAATAAQYTAAFQYTRDYLVETHYLSNLLFAWAPSRPTDHGDSWKAYYPSDAHTDIICFDRYDPGDGSYKAGLVADCNAIVKFADAHQKIAAICESGFHGGSQNTKDPNWWNATFLQTVLSQSVCARGITYMQTWTNSAPDSYWIPLSGQPTAQGFLQMAEQPNVLFAMDLLES